MKVFFTASKSSKPTYQKAYNIIIKTLKDLKQEVISLEVQKYSDILTEREMKTLSKRDIHHTYIKKAIRKADAVIIEASSDIFRIGYESNMALSNNKPVLCLSDSRDYSEAIGDSLFYAEKYNDLDDLSNKVKLFINKVEVAHLLIRFGIYMSSNHKNFLEWKSKK